MSRRATDADPLPWERPSPAAPSLPPHIRKMVRRYDAVRLALIRLAQGGGVVSSGALSAVAEEAEEVLSARGVAVATATTPAYEEEGDGEGSPPPEWAPRPGDPFPAPGQPVVPADGHPAASAPSGSLLA